MKEYDAADIRIIEFDEHVRQNPGMYFEVGRSSPELATRVLCAVLRHALHPATRVGPAHTLRAEAAICGDLAFWVADDQADALDPRGRPRLGYYGSLLGPDRWLSLAAGAVSSRTVVEVRREGVGFRQQLAGGRPVGDPEQFTPPSGTGTRVAFELDETYVGPHSVITPDLSSLDLHGPLCDEPDGPGCVVLRDMRVHADSAVHRYR
ncbi:hypothetical protein [Streptomyces sp. NPDC050121]|uniref:hypothetical protein n=1 Tax=Streptomyces sp. NPDC050121 TaxID=3365601 RepID=UPI003798B88D